MDTLTQYSEGRPDVYPLSPDEIRHYLRIDTRDDDQLLLALQSTAVAHVEDQLGRAVVARDVELLIDRLPVGTNPITLPVQPVTSVTDIDRIEAAGWVSIDSDTYEIVRSGALSAVRPVAGARWPETQASPRSVRVRYRAGAEDPLDVPEPIKLAILLLIGHWYEHREASSGTQLHNLPLGVDALIAPYRVARV